MPGRERKNIEVGMEVEIVQKHHQRTGELTDGTIKEFLPKPLTILMELK